MGDGDCNGIGSLVRLSQTNPMLQIWMPAIAAQSAILAAKDDLQLQFSHPRIIELIKTQMWWRNIYPVVLYDRAQGSSPRDLLKKLDAHDWKLIKAYLVSYTISCASNLAATANGSGIQLGREKP